MPAGTTVTISGSEFDNASAVTFNGVPATFSIVHGGLNTSVITAVVPIGATTGLIGVTTPGGTAYSASNFQIGTVVTPPPTVGTFSPTSGAVGVAITIVGTNFTGATSVYINSVWSASFTVNSDTQITAIVPSGATSGKITVTTPGGSATSAASFTVQVLTGKTVNVDSYGTMQAAYDAAVSLAAGGSAVTLKFSAKTYTITASAIALDIIRKDSWSNTIDGPTMTNVSRSGIITLEGSGTTIRYNADGRYCWLQAPNVTTGGNTYGNIVINGFTFDDNGRGGSGNRGTVIWAPGANNYSNISVTNCSNLKSGIPATGYAGVLHTYAQKTDDVGPIFPICFEQTGASGSYTERLTVDGCTLFSQGQCVAVYGNSSRVLDQINQSNSTYDNLWYAGSNTMVGGSSIGYRCSFNNVTCLNSLDDGIEVDAFSDVTITNCHFSVNRQAICLARIAATAPYKGRTETIHITGCIYSGGLGYYWNQSAWQQPMMPEMRTNGSGSWSGPVVLYLSNCSATWTGSGTAHALFQLAGPSSLTVYVHNCTPGPGQTLCNRSYISN